MFAAFSRNAIYRILCSLLMFLILVGLPLTSFPLLSRLTGAIVAPFSAFPLLMLMLLWLVPYILARGKFPAEIVPFLYFLLIAMAVSALAFFLDGFYSRGRDYFDQSIRAFLTVGIGLSFYLTFAAFPRDNNAIRKILLFIYIGGFLLIVWTLLEVILLRAYGRVQNFPEWVMAIRSALAIQSPTVLSTNRVTGFAYEPSWFVREFNLVLLPLLLSAVYQRKSIFKFHFWKIQVEDILMALALIVFGFSSPRVGLVAFLASAAYIGILVIGRFHRYLTNWYLQRRKNPPKNVIWIKIVLAVLIGLVMIVLVVGALTGYITIASQWDDRYQLLLKESTLQSLEIFPLTENRMIHFARRLAFFERMLYWFGGWNIFNDYPFGVGLGNAGFYFYERMNGAGFDSYEMRHLIFRASYLPNTKNLWTRLLSETGFIGFAVFLIWLYILWRSAGLSWKSDSKVLKVLGLGGRLFLLAYLIEGFSMDSFAMPYQWVMAGLISAGGLIARKDIITRKESLSAS